jgi:hypothetical protein
MEKLLLPCVCFASLFSLAYYIMAPGLLSNHIKKWNSIFIPFILLDMQTPLGHDVDETDYIQ